MRKFAVGLAIVMACPAGAQIDFGQGQMGAVGPVTGRLGERVNPATLRSLMPLIGPRMRQEMNDVMGETRSVVVVRNGDLLAEFYAPGFTPDTRQISWSMAKSITSALVGAAVHQGRIGDIDAPMPTPFPDGDPRRDITWRHWLTMVDGLDYKEIQPPGLPPYKLTESDVVQMMYGRGRHDIQAYIVDELPLIFPPGDIWNYSTAGYHLIGAALQRVYGEDFEAFLAGFFDTLGMDAVAEYGPKGTFLGGSLIYAGARDYARFGQLYLQDGVWAGTRILPEGWVTFARTPATEMPLYGAGFWRTPETDLHTADLAAPHGEPRDSYHAGGHEGQTIWIVPSSGTVIARTGLMPNTPENWQALFDWNQAVARAVTEDQGG